jgi:hypothetical protein
MYACINIYIYADNGRYEQIHMHVTMLHSDVAGESGTRRNDKALYWPKPELCQRHISAVRPCSYCTCAEFLDEIITPKPTTSTSDCFDRFVFILAKWILLPMSISMIIIIKKWAKNQHRSNGINIIGIGLL